MELEAGHRVKVPLQNRNVLGTVLRVNEVDHAQYKLRPVVEVVSEAPLLTQTLLELAQWMSSYYCCPLEHALRVMLPSSLRKEKSFDKVQQKVVLVKGLDEEDLLKLKAKAPKQYQIVKRLQEAGGESLQNALGAGVSSPIKGLEKKGIVVLEQAVVKRDPEAESNFAPSQPLQLNEEQKNALDRIVGSASAEVSKPILLAGVTGSGKTEVYLQASDAILKTGKTVIILVPEIALTPQTVRRFKSRFDKFNHPVAVLHSELSAGERHDEWKRLREGEAVVAIGARSAVFAPLLNVGLIIVDEEHETSYKQEASPRYQGRDLAVVRGVLEKCPVVLGSATPSLESWNNTLRGKYELVKINCRADSQSMPRVRVVDMRMESRKSKVKPLIFSDQLRASIQKRLDINEQVILFLNRRGFSRVAQCPSCGHKVGCPHCSLTLTYHRKDERMICHMCHYTSLPPKQCPECHDPAILFNGYGTEKVQEITQKLFKNARVARLDADVTKKRGAMKQVLEQFRLHKIDILIGTQMIAKGLHFPTVTLVGVLNADLSLHTPDFRASERTFQLLTQVAGRSGRGPLEGEVVIQTFTPHAPSIQYARHHDYYGFVEQELEFRRAFSYPPTYNMAIITSAGAKEDLAELTLKTIYKRLEAVSKDVKEPIIIGEPLPSPLEKAYDEYRFQMIVRSARPKMLTTFLRRTLDKITIPSDVRVVCDVDAYNVS